MSSTQSRPAVSLSWISRTWSSPIVTPPVSWESTKLEDVLSFAIVPRTSGRGWRASMIKAEPVLPTVRRVPYE
jgi:hypothetical protein